ncbi:MAG TPA: FAD-dependent oxidoreductase [Symbiobacteriaceae bacterium]|nr:FAD-dependent oxidoreductase [Symbiobacteriaceae bacterium]
MDARERWNVAVIGGGIAGLSAAIWARRLGLSTLVLEQEAEAGGQLRRIAQPIIDYPGLEGTTGVALSQRLRQQAETAGAVFRPSCPVAGIDVAARLCHTAGGAIAGDALVLAAGISPRRLGVPGEAEVPLHRPSEEPDWFRGKRVAVVGGGDRAAENALLLATVAREVHLIHRGHRLRARPSFQAQILAAGQVRLHLAAEVTALHTDGPAPVLIDLRREGSLQSLPVDACCIYVGNRPNTELVAGQVALSPEGYVITDRDGRSSAPGFYAVGDLCTAPAYQSLATAAGQAMVVAKHIALSLGHN